MGGENIYRRNGKKINLVRKNKLIRTKTLPVTLLIATILLLTSVVPAAQNNNTPMKTNEKELERPYSTGLAPEATIPSISSINKGSSNGGGKPLGEGTTMFGYVAYSSAMSNGPCYWDVSDPTTVNKLSDEQVTNFLSGGAWICEEKWYACQYNTGLIYTVTTDTGEIVLLGGGGNNLNGLAYDKLSNTLWGAGNIDFFSIDIDTGAQTVVGPFGGGVLYMIGIAFSSDGTCYGWDLNDYLWTIDVTTGAATQVGPLGINLNYAQDGAFDHGEGDILYLAAFTLSPAYGGFEYTVDLETGTATQVAAFPGTTEIDACMIQNVCIPPEHDVGIKSIDKPVDGAAYAPVTMQVTVKNYGNNSETTDVQYDIIKCEEGPSLLLEDFSGATFPPAGWSSYGYVKSFTNKAGGISPEAYYGYTSYVSNGYLMTPPFDVTGFEKVSVKFHLLGDFYGYTGTFLYCQYRKNASSPWRDVSPWANPVTGDLGPAFYVVGCYGWGEPIGSEFQARWQFGNYYYYLQYGSGIYIDDIQFIGCAGCAEYNNLVEDVEVPFNTEVIVDEFAQWTPSEWHNESCQNTWEDYPITTYTTLQDNNAKNNKKIKLLHLYYPWLHDVGTMTTEGPQSGPAQIFPVKAKIKNTGQYQECCFKVYAKIFEFGGGSGIPLLSQYFPSSYPWPPTGWTRTHSNWQASYSSQAGGSPYELRFYYYPSSTTNFRFISPMIDTTGLGSIEINFKHMVNHFNGPYTLKVETSKDKISWSTAWEIVNPSSGGGDVSAVTSDNVGTTTYVSWTLSGNSYNINYWYIDNIDILGFAITDPEYTAEVCCAKIDPGEEQTFTFPNWTPAFLEEETTGVRKYSFKIYTDLTAPLDNNAANDAIAKTITLDYFHDVAVEVTEPIIDRGEMFFAVDTSQYPSNARFVWFDPTKPGKYYDIGKWPNTAFPQGATIDNKGLEWVCDTNGNIWKKDPMSATCTAVGNAGTGELTGLAFHEKSKVMYGSSSNNLYTIDMTTGKGKLVGPFQQLGYYMISLDCDKDGTMYGYDLNFDQSRTYKINLDTGKATAIGLTGVSLMYGQDMAYDWKTGIMYAAAFNYGTFQGELHEINLQTGKFTFKGTLQGGVQTTCLAIPGGGPDVYVPLGTQSIEGKGSNKGTFPEYGMTCYADIYEYITNCSEPTLAQAYVITPVDIPIPLTGTIPLVFGSYDFAIEGNYKLKLNLEDNNDDKQSNNIVEWNIGADGTNPTSSHTLWPAAANGDNGWYVSDILVNLSATDPSIGCDVDGSGVMEIKYTVNGVAGSVSGDKGSFTIHDDGTNIEVKYWAIDMVGNTETKNTFYINMYQTKPIVPEGIAYSAEKVGSSWFVTLNVTCSDVTSIMNRVEWAINDVVQETTPGSGPVYTWTFEWASSLQLPTITFKATAYDTAGNSNFVTITGDKITESPVNDVQSQPSQPIQKTQTLKQKVAG